MREAIKSVLLERGERAAPTGGDGKRVPLEGRRLEGRGVGSRGEESDGVNRDVLSLPGVLAGDGVCRPEADPIIALASRAATSGAARISASI